MEIYLSLSLLKAELALKNPSKKPQKKPPKKTH